MKIVTVVGARPQFIKASVVSRALGESEVLVHTGQHYDANMSDVFFEELEIPRPSYNLGIGGGRHGAQTGKMLEALEAVFLDERPDFALVYGDTNSTLAGALAAAKLHLPVAHVEAGLRSFDRKMPEEVNRILTDHVSDILFTPTEAAVENLRREGLSERGIHHVGDVMYDAALLFGQKAEEQSSIVAELGLTPGNFILATVHRAENTDNHERLRAIFGALSTISEECSIVLPLHPRTRDALAKAGIEAAESRGLTLIEPASYLDMVQLQRNARLIVTDSGGVQKEAFFHQVPCVTLRDTTEWVELVTMGWNRLAPPTGAHEVATAIAMALEQRPAPAESPYGGGRSAERIVEILRAGC